MNGVYCEVHQDQNFCKWDYQFLMKPRHVQSTRKRKFFKFLEYSFLYCCCVLVWSKNIQITLQGSSHVCCYLFLQTFQLSRFCRDSPGFWYAVPVSRIESVCPGFYICYQKNVHIYIVFISSVKPYIYSELHL